MNKFVFVIGGTKSGKSDFAVSLAKKLSKNVAYLATCYNPDNEMQERIKSHKKSRPKHWKTFEVHLENIESTLLTLNNKHEVVIIDCLGLFITNLLEANLKDAQIKKIIKRIISIFKDSNFTIIVVSNEVGSGIVPDNKLARKFRDVIGLANQSMALSADEVVFLQSGIPIIIKGEKDGKVRKYKK